MSELLINKQINNLVRKKKKILGVLSPVSPHNNNFIIIIIQ